MRRVVSHIVAFVIACLAFGAIGFAQSAMPVLNFALTLVMHLAVVVAIVPLVYVRTQRMFRVHLPTLTATALVVAVVYAACLTLLWIELFLPEQAVALALLVLFFVGLIVSFQRLPKVKKRK